MSATSPSLPSTSRGAGSRGHRRRRTRPATASPRATWTPAPSCRSTAARRVTSGWRGPRRATRWPRCKASRTRLSGQALLPGGLQRVRRGANRRRPSYDPSATRLPGRHVASARIGLRPGSTTSRACSSAFASRSAKRRREEKPEADKPAERRGREGRRHDPRRRARRRGWIADEKPDLVLWHYQDKRLQSQQQVEEDRDKRFSLLCAVPRGRQDVRAPGRRRRCATWLTAGARSKWAVGTDDTPYERRRQPRRPAVPGRLRHGLEDRRPEAGRQEGPLVLRAPRPTAAGCLYYDDGHYLALRHWPPAQSSNITQGRAHLVRGRATTTTTCVKPPVPPARLDEGRRRPCCCRDGWDVWMVPAAGGTAVEPHREREEGRSPLPAPPRARPRREGHRPRPRRMLLAVVRRVDQEGRHRARRRPGSPARETLLWDDAAFARVMKAKNADVYVYGRETPQPAARPVRRGPGLEGRRGS